MSASSNHSTLDVEQALEKVEPELESVQVNIEPSSNLVKFEPNDPENPKNWPRMQRWYITILGGVLVLNATFASSAPSGVLVDMAKQFGFSEEVGVLMISLFVAGYCVGPLFWGPLSEQYGRRPIFVWSFLPYTAFQIGCALAPNTAAIMIFRLLGGIFAAAPLTNSGALIADIWDAGTRGKALALFTLAPFAGPAIGPLVGGYISTSGTSWRWLFWTLTIFAGLCWILMYFTLPETYAPIILVQKAKRLRKETGDESIVAPMETQVQTLSERVNQCLSRPFEVLFLEPMLMAVTLYMSFVYGCIYLLFEAYPIVFVEGHHFSSGASGLMFLPVFLGGICAVIAYLTFFNPRYERAMRQHAPNLVPPESRLEVAVAGAPLFVISFFWFGWTSFPHISFWAPMMSGLFMGSSCILIFLALFNYIIDTYLFAAASALAATTVVRSIFGAVFPLFARQMYESLNPRWSSTLLGCIALIMLPIPFALIRFGPTLRARSKFAPNLTPEMIAALTKQ